MLIRRVVGNSMFPTLVSGKIVIARKNNYRVHDVVIVKVGNREIIKRIIQLSPTITLKGDNMNSAQYTDIKESDILGVVIWPKIKI